MPNSTSIKPPATFSRRSDRPLVNSTIAQEGMAFVHTAVCFCLSHSVYLHRMSSITTYHRQQETQYTSHFSQLLLFVEQGPTKESGQILSNAQENWLCGLATLKSLGDEEASAACAAYRGQLQHCLWLVFEGRSAHCCMLGGH
jgi:hypothetical protein